MKVVSCAAPFGTGGLGQHLAHVVEEARSRGELACYYAWGSKPGDPPGRVIDVPALGWIYRYTPLRFHSGWKAHLGNDLFDRAVASRLTPAETVTAFSGQASHSFRRARRMGYSLLELESPTTHIRHVARQFERAGRRYGIEGSWLNRAQIEKALSEYEMADAIVVASEYSRQSFLEEGVAEERLRLRRLQVHPRYRPAQTRHADGIFRVVYVGSLTVAKGLPVLIEAFSRLSTRDAQLTLIGGWGTRGMRRFLEEWLRRDPRIRIAPGDPLPYLQRADVCVHPSFDDGFAYAPMEALACGVPVIVTANTGMKEHVREGVNGFVVPAGDSEAVLERLEYLGRTPLAGGK